MAEPFLAQIMIAGFNFAPRGWAKCDGQILPINQNQSLYSLLGTTYGGDGRTSFALPDLRGRAPLHQGSGHNLGQRAGEEGHSLTIGETPAHRHPVMATSAASNDTRPNAALPSLAEVNTYGLGPLGAMRSDAINNAGSNQPHQNMMPFLTLNFCIALQGLFPSRN